MSNHSPNIQFYNENASKLYEQYQSLEFEKVHASWLKTVDLSFHKTALDVGAGSGRDALALSNKGLSVTAIEPAKKLMEKGLAYTGEQVTWICDALPNLSNLPRIKFDLILVSALWMHLNDEDQSQSLERLIQLMSMRGVLVITLRHGVFEDTRIAYATNRSKLITQAEKLGLSLLHAESNLDQLNRAQVYWETLVLHHKF